MKLSVTTRLYIGFALAILFVSLIGVTSYRTFSEQQTEQASVAHTYEVLNQLAHVQISVDEVRSSARSFLIAKDSIFKNRFNTRSAELINHLAALEQLVFDNPVQHQRALVLHHQVNNLQQTLDKILDDFKTSGNADLQAITTLVELKLDVIRKQLTELSNEENKQLVQRSSDNDLLLRHAINVLFRNILLTLLIVFFLIYFIFKEGKRRQKAEEEINNNLQALTQLNITANQKNWLLTGLSQLNNAMQGESTVSELCSSTLKTLVEYFQLPAGAFYTIIEEVKGLYLLCSVGITDNIERTFSSQHTLAAHVLDKKELTVIKNIPENYWSIESGVGRAHAGEIAYMPLIEDGSVIGIIELASFQSFSEEQTNFLKVAADSIVIALQSALSRRKVKNLLEHLAQQKDELLNQQEELYKTNEELSRQTEILQRSEEELRVQEEELRQTNDELLQKNEAMEFARQTLVLKNQELENASKYKSEFLANMSHELRTPLNSILILGKQLFENKTKNLTEKQVEYGKIIHKSGSDLLQLINDMLDLSKIEAGKVELHIEDVNIKNVEQDIKELFGEVAKEKNIEFTAVIEQSAPAVVQTDKQRLEQILKNLLSNAFKFTPRGGKVKMIISSRESKMFSISVADNGIGIPIEKQQLIFEAFQQAEGSTTRKYGGTGLGLSICRELVRMLGGEIQVQSKVDEGSTFTVNLPFVSNTNEIISKEPREGYSGNLAMKASETFQKIDDDKALINNKEKVVLIIEDDIQFATLLRDFAREHNYKAIIALQGDEGLIFAKKYKPDAIILDIKLPVIDGWTILRLLKDDESLKHIPVHIITGTEYNLSQQGNIVSFLKKPVDKQDIENAFELLMHNTLTAFKKILILKGEHLNDDSLQKMIEKRHFEVVCTYVNSVNEIMNELKKSNYDSIIADVGKDLIKAKDELTRLKDGTDKYNIPVIVYLDADISQTEELEFMKLSDVVIRDAEMSKSRLMDELELFLYKVQEKTNDEEFQPPVEHDKIFENKKILLVDDDMRNVFVLTGILEEHKMKVTPAVNGKDAIEILSKDSSFDMILMDIMMPEMDGFEATEKIRTQLKLTAIPIIALTAKAMPGDKEKCIRSGASDYITKPVDVNKLVSLMRVWLAR